MSTARDAILARVREATGDVPADEAPVYEWSPAPADTGDHHLAERLAERIADYEATVVRVDGRRAVPRAVEAILARDGARRIAVPSDLSIDWCPREIELVRDDPMLTHEDLGAVDGVLTGCALAIAETGTIVLDGGPGQGRRALTLLPDLHICIVEGDRIVAGVDQAFARLAGTTNPVTFVSGPSATSDIELTRVEGVHGPRRLAVVIVAEGRGVCSDPGAG